MPTFIRRQCLRDHANTTWVRFAPVMLLLALCGACRSPQPLEMLSYPSANYNPRQSPVNMIVIHYTVADSAIDSLRCLSETGPNARRVSAHYLIDRDGTIYRLVDERNRAWHAGQSCWRGVCDINSASIGIELVNTGLRADGSQPPFPAAQMKALARLCRDIQSRHDIRHVVGHSDVAPSRKQDPGQVFDWRWLAKRGVGVWTDRFARPRRSAREMLAAIGYDVSNEADALVAFQRHWYPEALTAGGTRTLERLAAVCDLPH